VDSEAEIRERFSRVQSQVTKWPSAQRCRSKALPKHLLFNFDGRPPCVEQSVVPSDPTADLPSAVRPADDDAAECPAPCAGREGRPGCRVRGQRGAAAQAGPAKRKPVPSVAHRPDRQRAGPERGWVRTVDCLLRAANIAHPVPSTPITSSSIRCSSSTDDVSESGGVARGHRARSIDCTGSVSCTHLRVERCSTQLPASRNSNIMLPLQLGDCGG